MPPTGASTHGTTVPSLLGRSTGFLGRHLWIWPLLAAAVFLVAGLATRVSVLRTSQQLTVSKLEGVLNSTVRAVNLWFSREKANARLIVSNPYFLNAVRNLLQQPESVRTSPVALEAIPEQATLRDMFAPIPAEFGYLDFIVFSPRHRVLASSHPQLLAQTLPASSSAIADRVLSGENLVTLPTTSSLLLPDRDNQLRAGRPAMFVVVPVLDRAGIVLAGAAFRLDPSGEFAQTVHLARFGDSGETYAFNRDGVLLTPSRFGHQLKDLALLPETSVDDGVLELSLRDPGVDLLAGQRPPLPRREWPLTLMAQSATAGHTAFEVQGYRDYRGVPVVGAWTWLPGPELGLATEMDLAEVRQPFAIVRRAYLWVFLLLGLSAAGLFLATVALARLRQRLQRAVIEARQLGQYALAEPLGSGTTGRVFRAHHAHLQRPVAVKLLDADPADRQAIARFEREVQATCRLTHPNTIVVYDYGRTPEGVFYYAMEYLEGVSLENLVQRHGPLPDARVAWILRQACGSLAEAHSHGLIHRDTKPANLFLTRRGGRPDVLKVLDFGLVKALRPEANVQMTVARSLVGTPLYLSPEAIRDPESVGPRSDLYALGAVGFFLLTGTPVFNTTNLSEVLDGHLNQPPPSPSSRRGTPVFPPLENLLLRCLDKNPALRPRSAVALEEALAHLATDLPWSGSDAEQAPPWDEALRPASG